MGGLRRAGLICDVSGCDVDKRGMSVDVWYKVLVIDVHWLQLVGYEGGLDL